MTNDRSKTIRTVQRLGALALTQLAVTSGFAAISSPAWAGVAGDSATPTVRTEGGTGIVQRTGPGTAYGVVGTLADGTAIQIACTTMAETMEGKYGKSQVWNRLSNGRWVTDVYVHTGTDGRSKPECGGSGRRPRGNDYPYGSKGRVDRWYMYSRECTSFVSWRMEQLNGYFHNLMWRNGRKGHWGNATHWNENARYLGYRVDRRPTVGSIAQWDAGNGVSRYGHVAYVAAVSGSRVLIEEYNYARAHTFGRRWISASGPTSYIHIAPGT